MPAKKKKKAASAPRATRSKASAERMHGGWYAFLFVAACVIAIWFILNTAFPFNPILNIR